MMTSLRRNRDGNISFISPIYKWCSYTLQTPPYDFAKKTTNVTFRIKLATIVYILVLLFGFAFSVYGKIKLMYAHQQLLLITKIIDGILLVVQLLASIMISCSILVQSEDIKLFLNIFELLDERLDINRENTRRKCWKFTIEIVVMHAFFFTALFYDGYVWCTVVKFEFYSTILMKSLLYFPYILLFLLTWNFIWAINVRFKLLNKHLRKYVRNGIRLEIGKINANAPIEKLSVKDIIKLYRKLCQLIGLFNKIYGVKLFLIMIWVVLGALMAISLGFVYGFTGQFLGGYYGLHLLILCCFIWPAVTIVS